MGRSLEADLSGQGVPGYYYPALVSIVLRMFPPYETPALS
jgi:hypothetical protein